MGEEGVGSSFLSFPLGKGTSVFEGERGKSPESSRKA